MQKKLLLQVIKILGPCNIEERGRWVPLSEDYINNKFDLDLDFGKVGEKYIEQVFEGDGRIEVKTERDIWATTGNIAIEVRCRGKLSGISTTDARTWIQLLSIKNTIKGGFVMPVKQLKARIKQLHESGDARLVMGGDDDASQMVLLPIKKIFQD
tara:strand:+ start:9267 stop:9731 length:465 start_codon:yes stop_codon:yes gene_type:complete